MRRVYGDVGVLCGVSGGGGESGGGGGSGWVLCEGGGVEYGGWGGDANADGDFCVFGGESGDGDGVVVVVVVGLLCLSGGGKIRRGSGGFFCLFVFGRVFCLYRLLAYHVHTFI